MTRALRAVCVIVGLAWAQSAVADPSLKDLAARTEVRAIETLTLTDQQFLTGDKNGKAVAIAGQLRFPQGASSRLPAMILQHGSGGPNGGHELWAKTFNEMGIASFLVDSFSGRGLTSTSTNQALLGRLNMVLDGYRAFDVLANHPRIDPARIAVMGFSRGGQSTLYASVGVAWALDAATAMAANGVSIEVVDLLTLLPWDRQRVFDSVKKTSRAIVLHEAPTTGGYGGEIAAAIAEEAFAWLDAPVTRIGGLDMPVPFSKALEEIYSPKGRLADAIRKVVSY